MWIILRKPHGQNKIGAWVRGPSRSENLKFWNFRVGSNFFRKTFFCIFGLEITQFAKKSNKKRFFENFLYDPPGTPDLVIFGPKFFEISFFGSKVSKWSNSKSYHVKSEIWRPSNIFALIVHPRLSHFWAENGWNVIF